MSFTFIRNECSEIGVQLMEGMLVTTSFSWEVPLSLQTVPSEQRSETAGPEAVLLLGCTGWELAYEPWFGQSLRGMVFPFSSSKILGKYTVCA